MDSKAKLTDVVETIYDACLDPALIPAAQNLIVAATGGLGIHLVLFDKHRKPIDSIIYSVLGASFANKMEKEYIDWYSKYDDYRIKTSLANGPGSVLTNEQLTPDSKRKSCPLYNEYFPDYHCHAQLIYGTYLSSGQGLAISQARSKKEGQYTKEESARFAKLSDHMSRSLNMRGKVISMFGHDHSVSSVLDNNKDAVVIVDENRKVLWANDIAKKTFFGSSPIRLHNGALEIRQIEQRKQTDKLIKQAVTLSGSKRHRCGFVTFSELDIPLVLTVFSEASEASLFSDREDIAVLVFHDPSPERINIPPIELIQSHYRLTAAESRAAIAIAQGLSPKEYATQAFLTESTVRSTLKIVYSKSDCHGIQKLQRSILALV